MRTAFPLVTSLVLLFGCGTSTSPGKELTNDSPPAATSATEDGALRDGATPGTSLRCERQPFASKIDIAEASGATLLADGSLLVVGDSGTDGAFLRLSSANGTILIRGNLPLDSIASDDLEGLSRIGSVIYGITSSGHMRAWEPRGKEFVQLHKSYSIAAKGDTKNACASAKDSNCGPNYEGLCLAPIASDARVCAGYVAAKASGRLLCLKRTGDGHLSIAPDHFIEVAAPKTLSGCHFDENDRLWFGNNVFAANAVGFVTSHEKPESAVITRLGPLGLGFGEAIAVGDAGAVYRFSDTAGSPSLLDKYICR